MSADAASPGREGGNRFGAFGGVFTPSILTIFGVIMFMRVGVVTGRAGLLGALVILLVCKLITVLTTISVSAVSTNTPVRGGGAYFLISRSLGPEFGGTIGVALFFAQSLSVPFYILGFTESLTKTFPSLAAWGFVISLTTAVVLFAVTWVGAGWAIKMQYAIMAVLGLSIIVFLAGNILGSGGGEGFSTARLAENASPAEGADFWRIFALYFPAVTGIMAGINMSGDLRDPSRAIPKGAFAAVAVGAAVYALQMVVLAGSNTREALVDQPYRTLTDHALMGAWFLVAAGVWCATVSSAVGSFMGAPRILQAFARDDLVGVLRPFAKGHGAGDEPRRALIVTMVVTLAVVGLAGAAGEGADDAFDVVAMIVTMFFLFTYGMTNLAAFVESFGLNPSFRPRFRFWHWSSALAGALGCAAAAVLIDATGAALAALAVGAIYVGIRRTVMGVTFGDARRGFVYARARKALLDLADMPVHPKNWRPTILVLSGNPNTRPTLLAYAVWFECRRGILSLVELLTGDHERMLEYRDAAQQRLERYLEENEIDAFAEAVAVDDFDSGVTVCLQAQSIGPVKANIVMFGWSEDPDRVDGTLHTLRTVARLGKSAIVVSDRGLPDPTDRRRRIDIWWRGRENGSLMLILAHMLKRNPAWKRAVIRLLRVVENEAGRDPATAALAELADAARIEAEIRVVVADGPFIETLAAESADATVVFLGFAVGGDVDPTDFHGRISAMLDVLPTTILVNSSGEADLSA